MFVFCVLLRQPKERRPFVCQFANHTLGKINHVVVSFGIKAALTKDAMRESEVMS